MTDGPVTLFGRATPRTSSRRARFDFWLDGGANALGLDVLTLEVCWNAYSMPRTRVVICVGLPVKGYVGVRAGRGGRSVWFRQLRRSSFVQVLASDDESGSWAVIMDG